MSEQSSHALAALSIDGPATLERYVRMIASKLSDRKTLHLYEHRNNTFSIHGIENISLAVSLLPTSGVNSNTSRTAPTATNTCELPATASQPPVQTLLLDPTSARNVVAAALFTEGRKAVIWCVSSDGRISAIMDGTPGCPGSLTEWLGERVDAGIVLAMRPSSGKGGVPVVGLAAWDPARLSLNVANLLDSHALSTLETVFVATNARELVLPDDIPDFDRKKIDALADKCGVALTVRRRKSFDVSDADILESVSRLAGARLRHDALFDGKPATSAATNALIEYCELGVDPALEGRVRVAELAVASCMQLDNTVMRALNILPFPGDGGKKASLFGLLNRCKTAMGSRLVRRWLSQPLQSAKNAANKNSANRYNTRLETAVVWVRRMFFRASNGDQLYR